MQYKYADHISDYIDNIGQYGDIHGHICPAKAPVHCGAGMIDSQRRIGISRNPQIHHAGIHNGILHSAEQQTEHPLISDQHQHGSHQRKDRSRHQKLTGRFSRLLLLFPADVLAEHDRAAGCQRCKQIDEDRVKLINQGHPGHCSLSCMADHQRICDSHQHHKELFQNQRNNHSLQIFIRK